jgi:hypothetical protein
LYTVTQELTRGGFINVIFCMSTRSDLAEGSCFSLVFAVVFWFCFFCFLFVYFYFAIGICLTA